MPLWVKMSIRICSAHPSISSTGLRTNSHTAPKQNADISALWVVAL
jgi:hypothetical protein